MLAVFWILFWFLLAIGTALSTLVSTQFKENFRTSGITLTALEGEIRRQSAEKELLKLMKSSYAEIEESRVTRQQARTALRLEQYPYEQMLKEAADLENIEKDRLTEVNRSRIETIRKEIEVKRPHIQQLEAEYLALDGTYNEALERYNELVEQSKKNAQPENPALASFARDSAYLSSPLNVMRWFFEMPTELVTLWLTLCMGALGSVIYVLRELFEEKSRPHSVTWFFMRPFLGMVLAFVMYLLIRTGQTTFTDPAGGQSSLNPFTISFLAVISGLMSDRAYSKIVSAAENVLGTGGVTGAGDDTASRTDGLKPDRSTASSVSDKV